MEKMKSIDLSELKALLSHVDVSEERVKLALQYVVEVSDLLRERSAKGEHVFWKDLPWIIQFWPVISFFYEERDLLNFLNPCPEVGGMSGLIGYSKKILHDTFPQRYLPKTITFETKPSLDHVLDLMRQHTMDFPVYCKPDVGERAADVRKVSSEAELQSYLQSFPANKALIVQLPAGSYFPEQREYGVQVVRDPKTKTLRITSAEFKQVPVVIGDGKKTIQELVQELSDITALQRQNVVGDLSEEKLHFIPSKGESVSVVDAASVSRGTKMVSLDLDFVESPLEKALTEVLSGLQNFSSGRFDLVAASEEELFQGKFEIIEGNGGAAIPLYVYRTDLSIEEVYTHLFTHFFQLRENARINKEAFEQGSLENFHPMTSGQIAWQLSKSLLQQRAQIKALSSAETRKMFVRIRKNARPERWELLKSRNRNRVKGVLGKVLEFYNKG